MAIAIGEALQQSIHPRCRGVGAGEGDRERAGAVGVGAEAGAREADGAGGGGDGVQVAGGAKDVMAAGTAAAGDAENGAVPVVVLNGEFRVDQDGIGIDDHGTAALHVGNREAGRGGGGVQATDLGCVVDSGDGGAEGNGGGRIAAGAAMGGHIDGVAIAQAAG